MKKSLLIFCILFYLMSNARAITIYVNINAVGNNDGTSWANAYQRLQDALLEAVYGDTIWVAQGTYYTTASLNRYFYFDLKNGVKLYGGFAGTETQLEQRDWNLYTSILSGDIGVLGDSTDNSYTVVNCGFVDSTTVFDGFVVTGGNADSQAQFDPANGRTKSGGGLYMSNSNNMEESRPLIENCSFVCNYANNAGGGIYCRSNNTGNASLRVENCKFERNGALLGGGIYLCGSSNNDSPKIVGCNFEHNYSDYQGASIFIENSFGDKDVEIKDNNFHFNFSIGDAGGILVECTNPEAAINIMDCDFGNNKADGDGSSISLYNFTDAQPLHVKDCNFVGDTSQNGVIVVYDGVLDISNSKFIGNIGQAAGIVLPGSGIKIFDCSFLSSTLTENGSLGLIYFLSNDIDDESHIVNCTFSKNNLNGKNLIYRQSQNNPPLRIYNTIITGNGNQAPKLVNNNNAELYISHSLVDVPDCTGIMSGPITCGPGNLYNLDPLFRDTSAGDYRLSPCSPARNAGSNAIVDSLGILTDIEGSPRIQGGTVDMGAYESPAFEATDVTVTIPACGPSGTGTAALTLANGCPPYFLDWGTGSTISDTSLASLDLPVGSYAITITDGRMEADTVSVTITSSPAITATAVAFPVNCANSTGGTASVEAVGGTGGFGFAWSSGGTSASVTGLAEGTYTVTVTDASGCTAVDTVAVALDGSLALGLSIQPVTCPGDSDGSATVQPIGGAMPFAWLWQSGEMTATIENLSGGTYAATVTDALGCTGDLDFTIEPLDSIAIGIAATAADCNGGLGAATASATGGTGSFSYAWDTGAMTATATLPAGPHGVTATDANGCTATATVDIATPPPLVAIATPQPPSLCHGASDGSIAVSPSGGTPPYGWGGPLKGLPPGSYTVTVTDANGCTATASATLGELPEIIVTGAVTAASSPTALDGSIMLNSVTGGTGSGYAFLWSNGSTSQNLTGLPTGSYTVTVTDSQGCMGVFSFFVDFNSAAGEQAPNVFGAAIVPNPSGSTGAVLVVNRPSNDMRLTVLDALGRTVVAEQEITTDRQELPPGLAPGSYIVLLKDGEDTSVLQWVVAK